METLDKNTLLTKKAELEKKFESISANIRKIESQEQNLSQQKQGLNVELFRLQGEYRVISELLGEKPVDPGEPQVEAPHPENPNQTQ